MLPHVLSKSGTSFLMILMCQGVYSAERTRETPLTGLASGVHRVPLFSGYESLVLVRRIRTSRPSVPFATGFSGVVAASETVKFLLGASYDRSHHYQHSFESGRGRLLQTFCQRDCECQTRAVA